MSIKDKPLRVLQVVGAMNYGGVESMLMNLHRHVDRQVVQFDYLVRSEDEGKHDKEICELGGNIYRIRPFRGNNPISYYKECLAFFEEHKEISIVHGHIGSSAALYLEAAKRAGCYTIAHSHNTNVNKGLKNTAYTFFSFPTRFVADALFACSTEAGISRYGKKACSSSNFFLFHNAIDINTYKYDPSKRNEVNSEFGFSDEDIVLGAIGRISEQKNPKYIFEIFNNATKNSSNVKCLWIGTGEQIDYYRTIIEKNGLTDRIIMTGGRSDVPVLLQRIDAYIMPSLFEGLPVSAIEAQASGTRCILADTISSETKICNLVTWMSIDTDPEIWAQRAIEKARENREIRESPISEVIESGYSIDSTASWLTSFYQKNARYRE